MRVERDDGRRQPRRARRLEHAAVAEMDAVERADRDRAPGRAELLRRARDVHASLASASSTRDDARVRLLDGERPDLGASKRPAVTAERGGDRADVGARADAQVERDGLAGGGDDVERVNRERRSGISTATPRRCRR